MPVAVELTPHYSIAILAQISQGGYPDFLLRFFPESSVILFPTPQDFTHPIFSIASPIPVCYRARRQGVFVAKHSVKLALPRHHRL